MTENQNERIGTQYALDGNVATMLRCESCRQWAPLLVADEERMMLVCAGCKEKP